MEDQLAMERLRAFRREHPGVDIGHGQFGTWQAIVPLPAGEQVVTRHRLPELLDRLDAITGAAA
jgi:hypothetical protein